jgi:hypothetical protein
MTPKFWLVTDTPVVTANEATAHALDRFAPSAEAHEIDFFRAKLREMGHDVQALVREIGQ